MGQISEASCLFWRTYSAWFCHSNEFPPETYLLDETSEILCPSHLEFGLRGSRKIDFGFLPCWSVVLLVRNIIYDHHGEWLLAIHKRLIYMDRLLVLFIPVLPSLPTSPPVFVFTFSRRDSWSEATVSPAFVIHYLEIGNQQCFLFCSVRVSIIFL